MRRDAGVRAHSIWGFEHTEKYIITAMNDTARHRLISPGLQAVSGFTDSCCFRIRNGYCRPPFRRLLPTPITRITHCERGILRRRSLSMPGVSPPCGGRSTPFLPHGGTYVHHTVTAYLRTTACRPEPAVESRRVSHRGGQRRDMKQRHAYLSALDVIYVNSTIPTP